MPGRVTAVLAVAVNLLTGMLAGEDAPPSDSFVPASGTLVVFVTDSHVALQTGHLEYLEDFFLTRFPQEGIRLVSVGIRESEVGPALQQFQEDLADQHPTHVAVLWGFDEQNGQSARSRQERLQAFRRTIVEIERCIRDLGATPVYLSPATDAFPSAVPTLPERTPEQLDSRIAESAHFTAWLREFAEQSGADVLNLQQAWHRFLRQPRQLRDDKPPLVNDDGQLRPLDRLDMTAAFLEQLDLARPLSSIEIAWQDESLAATAEGGLVMNLEAIDGEAISFLWLADALPWMTPAETAEASQQLDLAERFNRETLSIRGLPSGLYEVLIDDRSLGRYDQNALTSGIALQRTATPQSDQALRVAKLNRERHGRASEMLPESEQRQELLADDSAALLAELRSLSQPVPRTFTIRPVQTADVRGRVLIGGSPISGAMVELHDLQGPIASGSTDAMGFYRLTAQSPNGIEPGAKWLVVLANMVLPKFISLEQSGHRVMLRPGLNEIELHFEESTPGE